MNHKSRLPGVFLRLLPLAVGLAALATGRPLVSAVATQDQPPDHWLLPVTGCPQETPNWCWAASAQMVLGYFGTRLSQSEIANVEFARSDCAQRPVADPCNQGGSPDPIFSHCGFTFDNSGTPPSPEDIMKQVFVLKKPFTFAWNWPGGGGHVAVVVGYAKLPGGIFAVECLDPWPPPLTDARDLPGGQFVVMTYDRWVADTDHTFQGCTFNIAKK